MKNITRFGLFLFLGLLHYDPASATTSTRYYAVELILFENLTPGARQSEHWPQSVELQMQPGKTIEIGKPYPGPLPKGYMSSYTFKPLRAKEYRLNAQAQKINKSDSRRVLLHTGWRQPGMDKTHALSVHFKRQISAPASALTSAQGIGADAQQARFATPEAGELEGMVKVILARYLHVDADIVFRPKTSKIPEDIFKMGQNADSDQGGSSTTKPIVYRMHQTRRRMRSRQLHYLDNPVLGMLVLITPFESRR